MVEKQIPVKQILISQLSRIGITHLQGIEKYLNRNDMERCFLITSITPHKNVLEYAKKIPSLKIIVSANFQQEKRKIKEEHPGAKIISIDPYHLASRDGMLDA